MANRYLKGDSAGIPKDPVRAVQLFKQGVAGGNVSAMISLAWCYRKATGVEKDAAAAAELYRRAAQAGNADAMSFLGQCYQVFSVYLPNQLASEWRGRGKGPS